MAHFLVTFAHGPAWDDARGRREQDGWDAHSRFMDKLTKNGSIVLGGPVGDDLDADDAVILVSADDPEAAARLFEGDPWNGTILTLAHVQRWTLWLANPATGVRRPD